MAVPKTGGILHISAAQKDIIDHLALISSNLTAPNLAPIPHDSHTLSQIGRLFLIGHSMLCQFQFFKQQRGDAQSVLQELSVESSNNLATQAR